MSASLYDTFGNEIGQRITQQTLEQYLEDATIKFVLPEASSEILSALSVKESANRPLYDAVKSRLIQLGFKEPNAKALASVLLPVAAEQGINPLDYFQDSKAALKLANDTYDAINFLRPPGNRIGLRAKTVNVKSRIQKLIQP